MKRITTITLFALMALTAAVPANAQYQFGFRAPSGGIDSMQARLQARINSGITSGRINSREAAHLQARLDRIAQLEARLRMSHNRLSGRERSFLMSQLFSLNNQITREMNDFDRRRVGYWNNGRRYWH